MAVTEESRYQLFQSLEGALGTEKAATLMELLPPVGWADVATKRDLDQLRAATKTDLDQLRAATKTDLDQLRAATKTDLDQMGLELRGEMGSLGSGLRSEMASLGSGVREELANLRAEFFREQRNQTIALISANTAIVTILFAAFRLL